ncbi:MAG: hypothetical protein IKK37_07415 [Clostridia bacterium]|nr:hypothetical protein [Clostridia bacterium]
MKSKRLLFAMEDIKDEFIESAAPKEKKKAPKTVAKICALAACVAVIVTAGVIYRQNTKLPPVSLPDIFDGGMSMEAYFAYSADELVINNPWSEADSPKKLPVYKNTVYVPSGDDIPQTDLSRLEDVLLDYAERLGIKADRSQIKKEETQIYIETDTIKITLNSWLRLNAYISGKNVLPSGYTLDCYAGFEELSKTAEYLKEKYASYLNMKNPTADISMGDYDVYGKRSFSLSFYDADSDIEKSIENYNFNRVSFSMYEDGVLHISQSVASREAVGNYPINSLNKATELLEQGEYVTSVNVDFPGVQAVKKAELVYYVSSAAEYFVPYYRFYVEIEHDGDIGDALPGMKSYGTYYVPAIKDKYIVE